jgi:hypothetical protein
MSKATLNLQQIDAKYTLLTAKDVAEGIVKLKVSNNPNTSELYENPNLMGLDGYLGSYFVNFDAIDSRKIHSVAQAVAEAGGELPITEMKFNLTKEVLVFADSKRKEVPMKGQSIPVQIRYATSSEEEDGFAKDKFGDKIIEVVDYTVPAVSAGGSSFLQALNASKNGAEVSDDRAQVLSNEVESTSTF